MTILLAILVGFLSGFLVAAHNPDRAAAVLGFVRSIVARFRK
jgi:hypothetical protein